MGKKRPSRRPADWPQKAYKNLDFLTAPEGRIVRVLSEFLEPASRFEKSHIRNTIVFFGSARTLPRAEARKRLRELEKRAASKKRPPAALLRQVAVHEEIFQKRVHADLERTVLFVDPPRHGAYNDVASSMDGWRCMTPRPGDGGQGVPGFGKNVP